MTYLEIGTAFREQEGLSTLMARLFQVENNLKGNVYSFDVDQTHVDACQQIIQAEGEGLLSDVIFHLGNSVQTLPAALSNIDELDVVFIDGGADARVNLLEFDLCFTKLSSNGIIIVDDIVYLEKTQYKGRRDFGKGQLIYPILLIADSLNYFMRRHNAANAVEGFVNEASTPPFLAELVSCPKFLHFLKQLQGYEFVKIGCMLVIARPSMLQEHLGINLEGNLTLPWSAI